MKKQHTRTVLALAMLAGAYANSAQAYTPGVYFTEALVDPLSSYFFIEITNLSGVTQSLSGWGFDNVTRGMAIDLSNEDGISFVFTPSELLLLSGSLSDGQSLIITNAAPDQATANNNGGAVFADLWGSVPAGTKIVQSTNAAKHWLSASGDELNLFNSSGQLVDRLTYSSNFAVEGLSRQPENNDALGQNAANDWVLTSANDMFGSYQAAQSLDVGNPGFYDADLTAVPEPETYAMMLAGVGLIGLMVRRRKGIARIYA